MTRKLTALLALVPLMLAPALLPANAQEMSFAAVDANVDGAVTLEEASAAGWGWTDEEFAAADADGDGMLSEMEFLAATGQ